MTEFHDEENIGSSASCLTNSISLLLDRQCRPTAAISIILMLCYSSSCSIIFRAHFMQMESTAVRRGAFVAYQEMFVRAFWLPQGIPPFKTIATVCCALCYLSP